MPILVAPPDSDHELGQGDLLDDVKLFETEPMGKPKALTATRALVISRDCAAVNKPRVVVAPVEFEKLDIARLTDDLKGDYDTLKRHLSTLRDGGVRPDHFYLGAHADEPMRMTARFDRLCSLELPANLADRHVWVREHRLARLADDFVRALPVRLFWTFSRVGFDDVAWYPTRDLGALITAGSRWISKLQMDHDTAQLQLDTGATGDVQRDAGLRKARDGAAAKLADAVADIARFREELAGRK